MMFSLDAMVEKLCEHAKLEPARVRQLIAEKQDELSGLVSEEGAAYIVARELGLNMLRETRKQLKVRSLVSGLRSVDLVARVARVFEERQFEKDGKKGVVVNLLLGDETGMVRLSLWNEETGFVREGKLKEGDVVKVSGGWVKSDNRDNPELRVGRGSIEKVDQEVSLPDRNRLEQDFQAIKREPVRDFREGGQYETRAALVQVFGRNPFFMVCPQCEARVKESDGKWLCDEHGEVRPKHALVLSGIIDDGTGNIRAVFFRDMAEKMFGKSVEELRKLAEKATDTLAVFEHVGGLGSEFVLRGRVKTNAFTENPEFMISSIEDVDMKRESRELLRGLS
jgi:ssDNA-binding replication factor A large subunit